MQGFLLALLVFIAVYKLKEKKSKKEGAGPMQVDNTLETDNVESI